MIFKEKLEYYTEAEFTEFLDAFIANPENLKGKQYGKYVERLVKHFEIITEHPAGSDLLFYPEPGFDDSSECVLNIVKEWRAQRGKPGFRKPGD